MTSASNSMLARFNDFAARIPHDLIAVVARISIGTIFLRSGMLKVEGWSDGTTVALFRDEYRLPLLSPEIAAPMAMAAELLLPPLLIAGLMTRFASLALLAMTLVIQVFVYPNAFDTHGVWAVSLLYLIKYGAGNWSVDRFIEPARLAQRTDGHGQAEDVAS